MSVITVWKQKAKLLRTETHALYLAYRDPRVPWYAKAFGALVIAYALCPLDLIPDFIPILGYLDDILLIPLGITLAIKMIPKQIMDESRRQAEITLSSRSVKTWPMTLAIVLIWAALIALIVWKILAD